jgi:site-specific recombinase XerD
VAAFLAWLKARKYSPATVAIRHTALARLQRFMAAHGTARFQDVTVEVLGAFRHDLEASRMTSYSIEGYLSGVRQFFSYLEATGRLFANPAREICIRRAPPPLPRVVGVADIRRLLATPDVSTPLGLRDRAMLETLYATGMRRGELLGLALFDLDLDAGTVRVLGKGRKERVLPLGRHAVAWLRRYMREVRSKLLGPGKAPTDALWLNLRHQPCAAFTVESTVRKYARQAGIPGPVTAHTLRRSCATHMLANGAHPLMVSELLGHSTVGTLTHYLRVTIRDLRKTHAASKPGE